MVTLKYYKFIYSLILIFMFSLNSINCMNSDDADIETYEDLTESNEIREYQINIEEKLTFLSYISSNDLDNVKKILEKYPMLTNMEDPISPIIYAITQNDPKYDMIFTLIEFGCNINQTNEKLDLPIIYIIKKINEYYEDMQLNILIDILNLLLKNETIVTEEMILLANDITTKNILSIYFYEEKETSCQCSLM